MLYCSSGVHVRLPPTGANRFVRMLAAADIHPKRMRGESAMGGKRTPGDCHGQSARKTPTLRIHHPGEAAHKRLPIDAPERLAR